MGSVTLFPDVVAGDHGAALEVPVGHPEPGALEIREACREVLRQ